MHSRFKLSELGLHQSMIEALYGSYDTIGGRNRSQWKNIISSGMFDEEMERNNDHSWIYSKGLRRGSQTD